MKWDEMDEKDKTRLVLEQVMKHFILNETATGWRTPEFPKGLKAPNGFHWPIAFWNTDGECWMIRGIATDPTIFNPLHDMNDAWQITELEQFSHVEVMRYWISDVLAPAYKYDCRLIAHGGEVFHSFGKTPQEAICLAGLRSVGVIFDE